MESVYTGNRIVGSNPTLSARSAHVEIQRELGKRAELDLRRSTPVIRFFLVVEVANAGDKWVVAGLFCPLYRLVLGFECGEGVIGVILDDVVINMAPLRAALRARLDIDVGHDLDLLGAHWRGNSPLRVRAPGA